MKRLIVAVVLPVFAVLALLSQQVSAAGFAIIEQGVKGLGNAYAGGAASADDPTTIFFNPAGMTRLKGKQTAVAGHIIIPSSEFSDNGSNVGGTALTGGDGGDAGVTALVPNFYYVQPINSRLTFGIGVNAPFGLATEYDSDWKGRYHAIDSEIVTININPSLAYKINDKLSIAGGINVQYTDATLSNAINLRLLSTGGVNKAQDADAVATVKGDDWGYGFNFGLLFELNKNTRLGVAYRSKIEHKLTGDSEFVATNAAAAGLLTTVFQPAGNFVNTSVEAGLTMPDTLSVSLYHKINDKWAIMGDITRTKWSRLQELRIDYSSNQADTVLPFEWKDSNRYAVGLSYVLSPRWTLRGGLALDETPIPSTELRSPRIPGNDRKWLTFGASFQRTDKFSLDFAYAHLFVSNTPINNTGSTASGSHVLTGSYDAEVDILSVQLNWLF